MGYLQLVICACVIVQQVYGHALVDSHVQGQVKELMESILTKEYNPVLRPYGLNGSDATLVSLQLKDVNILSVDETTGTFIFQANAYQGWVDSRLAYNDTNVGYLPIRDCKTIWIPDLYFSKQLESIAGFGNKHGNARLAKIYPDGRVYTSFRLTQTLTCSNLYKLDTKEFVCSTDVGSYGYLSNELVVAFKDQGINTLPDVFLPKYTFGGVTTRTCEAKLRNARHHQETPTGVHSCVTVDFKFTRA